jgi:hypothetical protein
MELTPGQRRLVFAVIVLALAALGIYLVVARNSSGTPSAASSTPATGATAPTSGASSVPPTMLPSATPASTAGGAEIYQWLPFSATDLTAAANTTTAFAKAYTTWSYTESATAYGATFNGLANAGEISTLEEGFATPGAAQQRTTDKQVSTGSGTIDQITAFGAGSITFSVTISQQVTSAQPTQTQSPQYSVTVVSSGNAWLVSQIQYANQGNQ